MRGKLSKVFDLSTSTHTLSEEKLLRQCEVKAKGGTLPATPRFPLTQSQIKYLLSPSILLIYYHNGNRHENRG